MRIIVTIGLIVLVLLVGLVITYRFAAERVEVVELHTTDEAGDPVVTRLWIVDHEGYPYLRASGEISGWYSRLHANGQFELDRNGEIKSYTGLDRREKATVINTLMQEKYTWGDSFVGFFSGSRDGSIPVEMREI